MCVWTIATELTSERIGSLIIRTELANRYHKERRLTDSFVPQDVQRSLHPVSIFTLAKSLEEPGQAVPSRAKIVLSELQYTKRSENYLWLTPHALCSTA